MKRRMLDLFCGLGGASAAFREAGWEVCGVDSDPSFRPDVTADLAAWKYEGPPPLDLIWASPPCTEFSRESMPWCRRGVPPDTQLVEAARRIILEARPRFWVIENVRGSLKWLRPILGEFTHRWGPFFAWSNLPPLRVEVPPFKEKLSSSRRAERAKIPLAVSRAVLHAIELTAEDWYPNTCKEG